MAGRAERELLEEQAEAVKHAAELVATLTTSQTLQARKAGIDREGHGRACRARAAGGAGGGGEARGRAGGNLTTSQTLQATRAGTDRKGCGRACRARAAGGAGGGGEARV